VRKAEDALEAALARSPAAPAAELAPLRAALATAEAERDRISLAKAGDAGATAAKAALEAARAHSAPEKLAQLNAALAAAEAAKAANLQGRSDAGEQQHASARKRPTATPTSPRLQLHTTRPLAHHQRIVLPLLLSVPLLLLLL
jgi:hypothetical protein